MPKLRWNQHAKVTLPKIPNFFLFLYCLHSSNYWLAESCFGIAWIRLILSFWVFSGLWRYFLDNIHLPEHTVRAWYAPCIPPWCWKQTGKMHRDTLLVWNLLLFWQPPSAPFPSVAFPVPVVGAGLPPAVAVDGSAAPQHWRFPPDIWNSWPTWKRISANAVCKASPSRRRHRRSCTCSWKSGQV